MQADGRVMLPMPDGVKERRRKMAELEFPNGKYPAVALAHNHIIRAAHVRGHILLKVHKIGDPFMHQVTERVFCDVGGQPVEVAKQPFAVWGEGTTDGWHLPGAGRRRAGDFRVGVQQPRRYLGASDA
jgi:hypothetical protein